MKVMEVIDNDWSERPIDAKTHMRDFRRKIASLLHRRQSILNTLQKAIPTWAKFNIETNYQWALRGRDPSDFPVEVRPYITKLRQIDDQFDEIMKQQSVVMRNMKYAVHDPALALRHAMYVRRGRYPEGEHAIASNARIAYDYAIEIIRSRFPEGESAIAKDPQLKHDYELKFGVKL